MYFCHVCCLPVCFSVCTLAVLGDTHYVLNPGHIMDGQGLSTLAIILHSVPSAAGSAKMCTLYVSAHHHHVSRGGLIYRTCSHDKLAKGSFTKHLIIIANCSIHYHLIGDLHKGLCYMGTRVDAITRARSVSLYFYRQLFYITI